MTGAFLNVFECIFKNARIEVMKTECVDKENYKSLKDENIELFLFLWYNIYIKDSPI